MNLDRVHSSYTMQAEVVSVYSLHSQMYLIIKYLHRYRYHAVNRLYTFGICLAQSTVYFLFLYKPFSFIKLNRLLLISMICFF